MALAGADILASDIVLGSTYVRKAATESRTTNTTLANDADFLLLPFAAGHVYQIAAFFSIGGSTSGKYKNTWVVAGGVAQLAARQCYGPDVNNVDVVGTGTAATTSGVVRMSIHNLATTVNYGTDGTNQSAIQENFIIETTTSGTAGTLTLQWAQNATSATATTMTTSSYLIITQIA